MSSQSGNSDPSRVSLTQECIATIRSLLGVPNFGLYCFNESELCHILQDGEVMCSLLREFSASTTRSRSFQAKSFYSSNSQLLAESNIELFLRTVKEQFGMEQQALFEMEDLLDMKNPDRVVSALHSFIKVCECDKKVEPFKQNVDGQLPYLIEEICQHEKQFVDKLLKLLMIRKELLGVLSDWSEDLIALVFKYTEQLYFLHKQFHSMLLSIASQGSQVFCQRLHSAFKEILPQMEIYFQYFSHLPTVNARLEAQFKKYPELKEQLIQLEKAICETDSTFDSLYDGPIRQMTNYMQLFKRLGKTAATEAPQSASLVDKTIQELDHLLHRANNFRRQAEQTDATIVVMSKINGLPTFLASPALGGLHMMDGTLKVTYQTASIVRETRDSVFCVLTTKHLVMATKAAKRLDFNYWFHFPITNTMIVKSADLASVEITESPGSRIKLERSRPEFKATTWVEFILIAQAKCFPRGWNERGHSFALASFQMGAAKCTDCKEGFIGPVLQGYVCRQCQCLLHPECLEKHSRFCLRLRPSKSFTSYFHSGIDRNKAVNLLIDRQLGSFLLRERSGRPDQMVMSIRTSNPTSLVVHIEIQQQEDGAFLLGQNQQKSFPSIDEMIEYYVENNLSESFKGIDCTLTSGVEA